MGHKETQEVQSPIAIAASRSGDRLWRNPRGYDPRANQAYGLFDGAADLIGGHKLLILPEHVGCQVMVFQSWEAKYGRGRLAPNQERWRAIVQALGGIADVAWSVDEYRAKLASWRPLPPELLPPMPSPARRKRGVAPPAPAPST